MVFWMDGLVVKNLGALAAARKIMPAPTRISQISPDCGIGIDGWLAKSLVSCITDNIGNDIVEFPREAS